MKKLIIIAVPLLVGLLAAHFVGAFTKFAIFEGQRALYSEEQLTKDLSEGLPKTMAVLQEHFAEDYEAVISGTLAAVKDGGGPDVVRQRGSEVTAEIRRKYAGEIDMAPDQQLRKLVSGNVQLLVAVREGDGDKVCSGAAQIGANAIPLRSIKKYFAILDELSAETFLTIHAGRTTPVDHGVASDTDWAGVISIMRQKGVTDEELGVVGNGLVDDKRYCGLMIEFLKSVEAHQGPSGARTRAAFAREIGAA